MRHDDFANLKQFIEISAEDIEARIFLTALPRPGESQTRNFLSPS
jgi:hypothetical protein